VAKPRIGAQLIIWKGRVDTDLPGVLDEVASLGYAGVETGTEAFLKQPDPKELLASRGLSLAGIHRNVRLGLDAVDEALRLLARLGGRYLLFSGAGGRGETEEEYRRSCRFLEEAGRRAKKQGVRVCYHNHGKEIVDDARGMKIILRETDPDLVSLAVDTYWVEFGGLSSVEFIRENLDRVAYLHLKDGTREDMKQRRFGEVGQGYIDFPAIMKLVEPTGLEWAVVEQDRTDKTAKESMGMSRRYIREKLGL